jgi:hypothetical protein
MEPNSTEAPEVALSSAEIRASAASAQAASGPRVDMEESWIRGLFLPVKSGSIDDASEEPLDFR